MTQKASAPIDMMTDAKRILLAGPKDLLRHALADQLSRQGFDAIEIASGTEAIAFFDIDECDAVLLDADIAGPSPEELCRFLRDKGLRLPILVLGGDPLMAEAWLDAGATACFAKPFRMPVLMQRLDSLIKANAGEVVRLGTLLFDAAARVIEDESGRRTPLTEKEVAILSYLRRAENRAVPREELLAEVWGYADGATTHTVETHIYRLRRKLGEEASALLQTQGGGYCLVPLATGDA